MSRDLSETSPVETINRNPARWPLPVRQIARRLEEEPEPLWQLHLLFDIAEFFIKVLGAWDFNRCRKESRLQDSPELLKKIADLKKRPSLGHWVGLIAFAENSGVPDLKNVASEDFQIAANSILKLRNKMAHQATPNRHSLSAMLRSTSSNLAKILNAIEEEKLEFVCEQVRPSNSLEPPAWGRFFVRSDGMQTDLFPWILALFENDETKTVLCYDGFAGEAAYVDLAQGDSPSRLPPQAGKWAADECRRLFEPGATPVFFDNLIDSRNDRICPSYNYINRDCCIASVLKTIGDFPDRIIFLRGDAGTGKTSLCCQLVERFQRDRESQRGLIELHHFCGGEAQGASDAGKILDNLALQLRHYWVCDNQLQLAALVDSFLGDPQNELAIMIDGLDEIVQPSEIRDLICGLHAIKVRWPGARLKIVVSGQPKIEQEIPTTFHQTVHTHDLEGFTAEDVNALAQKLELRNSDWTTNNTQHLLAHTAGLALYVSSFLLDVSSGVSRREDIGSLPLELTAYWESLIQKAIRADLSDEELRKKKNDAQELLGQIHAAKPELLSLENLKAFKEESDKVIQNHHSGDEKMILLHVLANFPGPLVSEQLREILGWESIKRVDRAVKPFGSLLQTGLGGFGLYHQSIADFLRQRQNGVMLSERADGMILDWLSGWRSDENKAHAWLKFVPAWNRRLLAVHPDAEQSVNHEVVSAFWERFNDFDWLLWVVSQKRHLELYSIGLALLGDEPFGRIHLSPSYRSCRNTQDQKVAKDYLSHLETKASEESERQDRGDAYVDKQDNEPLEILGGWTREEAGSAWEGGEARARAEEERLETDMPEEWFIGSFDTQEALSEIQRSFDAAIKSFEPKPDRHDPKWKLQLSCAFLAGHQSALAEIHLLPPDTRRESVAACIVHAGVFEGSKIAVKADEILAACTHPSILINSRPFDACRHAEWLYRANSGDFQFAAIAPLLAIREKQGTQKEDPIDVYLFDWLKNREVARWRFAVSDRVYLLGVGSDGEEILLSVSGKYQFRKRDGTTRTLDIPENAKIKWINHDMRFLALECGKNYRIFDCAKNQVAGPCTKDLGELNGIRVSENGALAVYLDNRSFGLWSSSFPKSRQPLWLLDGQYPNDDEKPRNFALSPNARFFYLRGEIREVSSGDVWRRIDNVSWEVEACFSSDGRMLALLEPHGDLKVFDVQKGRQIAHILCRAGCSDQFTSSAMAFSPDGNFLFVKTLTDAFSVLDLRMSSSPEAENVNGRLLLREHSALIPVPPIPVSPGLEQIAISDRTVPGDARGYFKTINLQDNLVRTFEQKQLLEAYALRGNEEDWNWLGIDCIGADAFWLLRPGFVLEQIDKTSLSTISRTDLLADSDEIDWPALLKVSEWRFQNSDTYSVEKLPDREWEILCFVAGTNDEVIAGAHPNLLLHISLTSQKILHAKNTGDFELNLKTHSLTGDVIAFANYSQDQAGIWDYRSNTWIESGKLYPENGPNTGWFARAVPFPWLGKVALICDWNGVFGWFDYQTLEVKLYDRDQWIKVSKLPAFSIANTPLMLAVFGSSGTNYLPTSGVCLVNPFSSEAFAHVFFETSINTVLRIAERRFCVSFEDGSFECISVEGLDEMEPSFSRAASV